MPKGRLAKINAKKLPELEERYQAAVGYADEIFRRDLPTFPVERAKVLEWAATKMAEVAAAAQAGRPPPGDPLDWQDIADHLHELADGAERGSKPKTTTARREMIAYVVRSIVLYCRLPIEPGRDTPAGSSASEAVAEALARHGWRIKAQQVAKIERACPGREDILWPVMFFSPERQAEE